ncbi:MAG: T9SS type A sorting domain-containing protein [Prolixibacteraceae bacterium]
MKLFLNSISRLFFALAFLMLTFSGASWAATGNWASKVTGGNIVYTSTDASVPKKDYAGNYLTVVYLENLGFTKIGANSNKTDVDWLLSQGYRVIELDYANNVNAVSPIINADIIEINDALAAKSFCGYKNSSTYQSYILFEGYRILRNIPYFKDDPTVYSYPSGYDEGDSLHMDIIYPANAAVTVPVVLSFSYSNSYATYDYNNGKLTDANKDLRLMLGYTLAGFNDSFLEGAPAKGIAWAIADHPKYCPWGNGGFGDAYKSYEVNPDAAQKVKSAVRTLRIKGEALGLSGKIGIYGFSRGSDAGSMAVGDRDVPEFENAGFNIGTSDDVQAAALGSGVFDFTQIFNTINDGDKNLEERCEWAWGPLASNYKLWETMGSAYLVETSASAPVLFFYNTDDSPYYQDQIAHFKNRLDSIGVPTSTVIDYGTGHAVPQTNASLATVYDFFEKYLASSDETIDKVAPIQICMVTIDMETGKNMVVWEGKSGKGIKAYKVYRESNVENEYDLIGTVPFNENSFFVDSISIPEQQAYRYKIAVVDSFDNESIMSLYHKPLFLQNTVDQDAVKLQWKAYEVEDSIFNFSNYVIYKGSDSTNLKEVNTVAASSLEYVDKDPITVNSRIFYRVGGVKPEACAPLSASEQFVQSMSNLTDYLKEGSDGIGAIADRDNLPLALAPNPATDRLQISFNLPKADKVQLVMYSLTGKVLYKTEKQYNSKGQHSETIQLNKLDLHNGIYFVKVFTEDMQGIKKFVKEK